MREFLKSSVSRFFKNERGNFAMLAGLLAPVIVFTGGSAIDFARYADLREQARAALDGASLAAASSIAQENATQSEAREVAERMFRLNLLSQTQSTESESVPGGIASAEAESNGLSGDIGDSYVDFSVNFDEASGTVTTDVNLNVPTLFAHLFGFDFLETTLSSTSTYIVSDEFHEKLEVVFVVDVTGSMRGARLESLKEALRSTMNILLPENGRTSEVVRVGLVPYSTSVNLGENFYESAVGSEPSFIGSGNNRRMTTCAIERLGENAFTDVVPETDEAKTHYKAPFISYRRNPNYPIPCPSVEIRPLTNDRGALLEDIEALTASGGTAGHIGITWGFNMLAEEWQPFWPEESQPAAYNEVVDPDDPSVDTSSDDSEAELPVRKILIVMTDGQFNSAYYNNDAINQLIDKIRAGEVKTGNASGVAGSVFCNLAKEDQRNLQVYTVAFQAGSSAERLLKDCATPDDPDSADTFARGPHYFDADSGEELNAAFRSIAAQNLEVLLTN